MTQRRTLIVLGSGTSMGVPVIGCDCRICTSTNPRNHRTRPSVLLQLPAGNLLIDTSPELRLQFLREKISLAHAVLFTHYHVDHLFGLDDVRLFPRALGGPLPLYCTDEVEEVIRQAFAYAFHPPDDLNVGLVLPKLTFRRIEPGQAFEVLGQTILPVPLLHGRFNCMGFRVGNLAYCTDVNAIPQTSWPMLEGLDTLILDAVRPGPSLPSHFGTDAAYEVIRRLRPKQTYLTHLSHHMDPETLDLPDGVELAYDGLRIEF